MPVRLIDLDAFDFATPRELPQLAAAVDETCRETGFLQVTGHGVPDSVIAEIRGATRAFFDLPQEEKDAYGFELELYQFLTKLVANMDQKIADKKAALADSTPTQLVDEVHPYP